MKINIEKAISIANQIANPIDADELKNTIYKLQKDNLDFKAELEDCKAELKIYQEWSDIKSLYQEHKTSHGTVMHVKLGETDPNIFYCAVCFAKQLVIPVQPVTLGIATILKLGYLEVDYHYCPSCEAVYWLK